MTHQCTKTYGHEIGLSCCFRQWRAQSHCAHLHGYALAFKFTFEADTLDENNWVLDFGGMKGLKAYLQKTFDHTLLVAYDDPNQADFIALDQKNLADVALVDSVGCESFAKLVYEWSIPWLKHVAGDRVRLVSVEVSEHGANSAIYKA